MMKLYNILGNKTNATHNLTHKYWIKRQSTITFGKLMVLKNKNKIK